jgi:hypothetical protein
MACRERGSVGQGGGVRARVRTVEHTQYIGARRDGDAECKGQIVWDTGEHIGHKPAAYVAGGDAAVRGDPSATGSSLLQHTQCTARSLGSGKRGVIL